MSSNISDIRAQVNTLALTLTHPVLQPLKQKMLAGVAKLEEPIQVAIIGKIKASKSTLVNAIIGKPNFAPTGQMEVTWNVSWINAGATNEAAEIVLKNGLKKNIPIYLWKKIAVGEGELETIGFSKEDIQRNISYIRLSDDAPILESLNIIDTPGLDATRALDSRNTIDFLNGVCRPDAIITLFVHNQTGSMMSIVEDFVGAGGALTPLNSIGVMAKMDMQWNISFWGKNMLEQMRRVANKQFDENASLRKSLFRIYPISALMFMASQTLCVEQLEWLHRLAAVDESILKKTLPFTKTFIESDLLPLSANQRKQLTEILGTYAIYIMIRQLRHQPDTDLQTARDVLRKESGADALMEAIYNHFGARANLLKAQSLYQNLLGECNRLAADKTVGSQIRGIKLMLSNAFKDVIYEVREYALMTAIYDNKVPFLSEDEKEDFKRLCGEQGSDAHSRLGMPFDVSPEEMYRECLLRSKVYRRKAQVLAKMERCDAMRLIKESYLRLAEQIKQQIQLHQVSHHYLYGNNEQNIH